MVFSVQSPAFQAGDRESFTLVSPATSIFNVIEEDKPVIRARQVFSLRTIEHKTQAATFRARLSNYAMTFRTADEQASLLYGKSAVVVSEALKFRVLLYDFGSQLHRVDMSATSTHEKLNEVYEDFGAIAGINDFCIGAVNEVVVEGGKVRFRARWAMNGNRLEISSTEASDDPDVDDADEHLPVKPAFALASTGKMKGTSCYQSSIVSILFGMAIGALLYRLGPRLLQRLRMYQ